MKHKIILLAIAAFAALEVSAARPRLVVNIVVGSMRAEDLRVTPTITAKEDSGA